MPHFYSLKGIIHQRTCVYTPQQNDIVKREHQHILNVARALKFQSNIRLHFWSDCILAEVHIINRVPTPLLSNKSPFEILYQKALDYTYLRSFRCLCYSSNNDPFKTKGVFFCQNFGEYF